jgi:hypothetical protein
MTEEEIHEERSTYRSAKGRFILMLVITIGLALFLVSASMALYISSGAAQVDLSRPGYSTVRSQAKDDDESDRKQYPNLGPINKESLTEFNKLFVESSKDVTSVPAFDGEVLSDTSLHITEIVPAE